MVGHEDIEAQHFVVCKLKYTIGRHIGLVPLTKKNLINKTNFKGCTIGRTEGFNNKEIPDNDYL
jgi:hypothetical protein